MANSAKTNLCAILAMLGFLTGCHLPATRNEPKSTVTDAALIPAPSTPMGKNQDGSLAHPTASQVSYQTASDAVPPSPEVLNGPVPLPETTSSPTELSPERVQSTQEIPEPTNTSAQSHFSDAPSGPFTGQTELSVEQLVAEVQARNPSLQAASAAWQAAAERYPQMVALDDPMFATMISPSGVGTENGGGWSVQASQKIPWCGKRALRGAQAAAEADVMRGDIGDVRLRLAEAARTAFYNYYLTARQLEVNSATQQLLGQFRENASNRYQANQATEQDVLLADVEIAGLESRRTELARDEQIAIARINTLLHRAANCPLPPPPSKVTLPDSLPSAESLQQIAAQSRPDLYAIYARIRAEEASLALAEKEYYPDVNLVGKYDGFMPEQMRPQVGFDVNVPIRYGRRSAAVREATNRLCQRRAEYQDRLDQVRYEVQSGWAQASQSQQVVRLYEEKIIPAAQRSLESAQANYISGKLDFLRLLDAERQLYQQREMQYQAIAEYHRRLAELERAIGESLRYGP